MTRRACLHNEVGNWKVDGVDPQRPTVARIVCRQCGGFIGWRAPAEEPKPTKGKR